MKQILIILPFFATSILSTQDITDWQIGVNANPFFFTRLNSRFIYQKYKQNFPNGIGQEQPLKKLQFLLCSFLV